MNNVASIVASLIPILIIVIVIGYRVRTGGYSRTRTTRQMQMSPRRRIITLIVSFAAFVALSYLNSNRNGVFQARDFAFSIALYVVLIAIVILKSRRLRR